jgi:hypothetical protein
MLTIDLNTARRFILGKQGLWLENQSLDKNGACAVIHIVNSKISARGLEITWLGFRACCW